MDATATGTVPVPVSFRLSLHPTPTPAVWQQISNAKILTRIRLTGPTPTEDHSIKAMVGSGPKVILLHPSRANTTLVDLIIPGQTFGVHQGNIVAVVNNLQILGINMINVSVFTAHAPKDLGFFIERVVIQGVGGIVVASRNDMKASVLAHIDSGRSLGLEHCFVIAMD